MKTFCGNYTLKNLIKEPTCFKNIENPSSIDVILTNKHRSFMHTKVLETGISDHHKFIVTVMKTKFTKLNPKTVTYRNYKKFNKALFEKELQEMLLETKNLSCSNFENLFLQVLEKHAPSKEKIIRGNERPFMNKKLKTAIMKRSNLKNKYHKNNSLINKNNYTKMRNYCVSLVKKNKKNYYSNLNTKDITDNKKFWKTVKPMFTDKVKHTENITLINNDTIISDKQSIAKMFNNFFINAVPNLNIKINDKTITNTGNISDPVLKAIKKYDKHPSILKIKNITKTKETFSFLNITENSPGKYSL